MNVLEAINVQKTYGTKTKALNGLSLSVKEGTIFGLLGPNGAGKTTFVRIVATQLLPTSGSISVHGYDVVKDPLRVRQRIAVVPQEARPLSLQTPYEHVVAYLVSRGVDISESRKRAEEILASLNLKQYRNTICSNLSGGLRQRVLIAMAMSTQADLLVLDEPTIGLDPVGRVDVWNLVRDYVSKGDKSILLTTHYMDEAEVLSDRLAIINKGGVIVEGTPAEIRASLKATHVVIVKSSTASSPINDEQLASEFQSHGRVLRAGGSVRVLTTQDGASELASHLLRKGGLEVYLRQVNLEDVFIAEIGEQTDGNSETN